MQHETQMEPHDKRSTGQKRYQKIVFVTTLKGVEKLYWYSVGIIWNKVDNLQLTEMTEAKNFKE